MPPSNVSSLWAMPFMRLLLSFFWQLFLHPRLLFPPALQLFHTVPGQDAAAAVERCAFTHHLEQKVLSALANHGYVFQVDHKGLGRVGALRFSPAFLQLTNPGIDQLAFQDQCSLVSVVSCGDLQ